MLLIAFSLAAAAVAWAAPAQADYPSRVHLANAVRGVPPRPTVYPITLTCDGAIGTKSFTFSSSGGQDLNAEGAARCSVRASAVTGATTTVRCASSGGAVCENGATARVENSNFAVTFTVVHVFSGPPPPSTAPDLPPAVPPDQNPPSQPDDDLAGSADPGVGGASGAPSSGDGVGSDAASPSSTSLDATAQSPEGASAGTSGGEPRSLITGRDDRQTAGGDVAAGAASAVGGPEQPTRGAGGDGNATALVTLGWGLAVLALVVAIAAPLAAFLFVRRGTTHRGSEDTESDAGEIDAPVGPTPAGVDESTGATPPNLDPDIQERTVGSAGR